MKLKKRVWLIFALLAAVYLVLNTGWKHYGRNERIYYTSPAGPISISADPTMEGTIQRADAVIQARVMSKSRTNEQFQRSSFTVWVEEVWFGDCPRKLLQINLNAVPVPGSEITPGDKVILFVSHSPAKDVWHAVSYSNAYILNPPTGLLHCFSDRYEPFTAYDGKSPGKLKRGIRKILREKAADWLEEYTGDVVKKHLWWR